MGTGGEVANALVCKTSIHGFDPHPVLQIINNLATDEQATFVVCGRFCGQILPLLLCPPKITS
jgi:hypothetical protein